MIFFLYLSFVFTLNILGGSLGEICTVQLCGFRAWHFSVLRAKGKSVSYPYQNKGITLAHLSQVITLWSKSPLFHLKYEEKPIFAALFPCGAKAEQGGISKITERFTAFSFPLRGLLIPSILISLPDPLPLFS